MAIIFLLGCQNNSPGNTEGELQVICPPPLRDMMKSQEMVFETLYPKASLNVQYASEEKSMQLFNQDSASMIILPRKPDSLEFADPRHVKTYPFFKSAITLITANDKIDTITVGFLENYADPDNETFRLPELIIKDTDLDIINYLADTLSVKTKALSKVYGFSADQNFFDYLRGSEGRIGMIDYAEISNQIRDPAQAQRMQNLQLVALAKDSLAGGFKPTQSSIAAENYLLIRQYYLIFKSTRMSVIRGFATFLLSEKGQRIILKSGLIAEHHPGREVKVSQ